VAGSLCLIEAAVAAGCLDFVFSATCATYGDQDRVTLDEGCAQSPGRCAALTVFCTDYDTPDGTCIRDYVHVIDLVEAHVLGLRRHKAGHDDR
jgi:UDP-glucose 4-epimerase